MFGRPGELQPVSAYQEIVNVYLPAPPSQHPKTGEAEPLVVESPAPDPGGVESLFLDLESWDPDAVENAVISLGDLGARIIYLENGGFLIEWDSHFRSVLGVTTQQTVEPEKEPVFSVSGAVDTGYLRTAVGDFYSYGRWTDTGPIPVRSNSLTRRAQMFAPWWP